MLAFFCVGTCLSKKLFHIIHGWPGGNISFEGTFDHLHHFIAAVQISFGLALAALEVIEDASFLLAFIWLWFAHDIGVAESFRSAAVCFLQQPLPWTNDASGPHHVPQIINVTSVKGFLKRQNLPGHNSEGVDIALGVVDFPEADFRCHVSGGSTESRQPKELAVGFAFVALAIVGKFSRQTEIKDCQVAPDVEANVGRLDVPVNNVVLVQMGKGAGQIEAGQESLLLMTLLALAPDFGSKAPLGTLHDPSA
mmetsp:Transcript_8245/g.17085  ORF Transcript_8245/g.17085 Transcript_8245/m.17085 type:complete len:252 (-) Transcript_8245:295-1050(-)